SFIAWIDLVRREVNVEHAAASLTNVFTAFLLATLLALVLIGAGLPDWTIFSIHPVSALILAGYVYGVTLSQHVTNEPMWRPVTTPSTRQDEREDGPPGESLPRLLLVFAGLGIGVAAAGFVVSRAGISVIAETALTGTVVGTLMTSVTTSIPELVTAYAAVRRGALTLAVGGIIGGNAFDVLFIAASDAAYRTGSIYQALTEADLFTLGWAIVLTGILGAGLVSREERGIGFEGVAIIAIYLAGVVAVWSIG
ncbi:MAG: sodium:calcium antiporter, partial [Chloroflexi bacterium]|nr:sodium:calcium antiporter [Chloroflexota bacterium]